MPRFGAAIFDLDGTLWCTTEVCVAAWNQVIASRAIARPPVTHAEIASLMGLTHEEVRARVFGTLRPEDAEAAICACFAEEERALVHAPSASLFYPGVLDGLAALVCVMPLFVVSNCDSGYLDVFLNRPEVAGCLVDGECYGRSGTGKADNIRAIVARYGLTAPVYVGDTAADELAACAAGVAFIHAGYGFGQASPDSVAADDFRGVVRLLLD